MFGRVACLLGRHRWRPYRNPESSPATQHAVCARCGKDKPGYEPPGGGQATGLSAGGW